MEGHTCEGWFEGMLKFPPTYKYEPDSDKYFGDGPKAGRRNPVWCDHIHSFGNEIELMNYKRTELKLSDHRPVTATFTVEVEDVCPRRLQRALTFTDTVPSKQVNRDMQFAAKEISSTVLTEMKEIAEAFLVSIVKNAFVTVLAYNVLPAPISINCRRKVACYPN